MISHPSSVIFSRGNLPCHSKPDVLLISAAVSFSSIGALHAHPSANFLSGLSDNVSRRVWAVQNFPTPRDGYYDPYSSQRQPFRNDNSPRPREPSIGDGVKPNAPIRRWQPYDDEFRPFSLGDDIICYPRERRCFNHRGHYMPSWTRHVFRHWG